MESCHLIEVTGLNDQPHRNDSRTGNSASNRSSPSQPLPKPRCSASHNMSRLIESSFTSPNVTGQWREDGQGLLEVPVERSTNPSSSIPQGHEFIQTNVGAHSALIPFDTPGEPDEFGIPWFNLDDDDTLGNAARIAWGDVSQLS
jgi:hypothetical protein